MNLLNAAVVKNQETREFLDSLVKENIYEKDGNVYKRLLNGKLEYLGKVSSQPVPDECDGCLFYPKVKGTFDTADESITLTGCISSYCVRERLQYRARPSPELVRETWKGKK